MRQIVSCLMVLLCTFSFKNAHAQTEESLSNRNLELLINQAIMEKKWDRLEGLLGQYERLNVYDKTLWLYATGALAQSQKNYEKAIRVYRQIIADNPQLIFPRFDLAIMLFQDKQLNAAEEQFRKIKSTSDHSVLLNVSDQYLQAINRANTWKFDFSANYIVNDNVNNASSSPTITIGKKIFHRTEDSLPQKAHGVNYKLGAHRDWNLEGPHYFGAAFYLEGDYYWDAKDYQQTQIRTDLGYYYKSVDDYVALRPFFSELWYGGEHYSNTIGINGNWSRWVTSQWRLGSNLSFSQQRYINKNYHFYNNNNVAWGGEVTYLPSVKQYWHFGLSVGHQKAEDKSESYKNNQLYLGWGYEWPKGISTRVNWSYNNKRYQDGHYLYGTKRKDNTRSSELTLWRRDWHWWGVTPKLSFVYNITDSNLPDLYSRKGSTVFLSVEKSF